MVIYFLEVLSYISFNNSSPVLCLFRFSGFAFFGFEVLLSAHCLLQKNYSQNSKGSGLQFHVYVRLWVSHFSLCINCDCVAFAWFKWYQLGCSFGHLCFQMNFCAAINSLRSPSFSFAMRSFSNAWLIFSIWRISKRMINTLIKQTSNQTLRGSFQSAWNFLSRKFKSAIKGGNGNLSSSSIVMAK